MKTIAFMVALTGLILAVASPTVVRAEERIEGTVVSATLTSCEFKPGTCEGSLVLDTKGKDGPVTIKVPKGTQIKRGNDHVFLPGLKGSQVAIAYVNDKGARVANQVDRGEVGEAVRRARLLVLLTAGLLLSAASLHAGELTTDVDGVSVELTSSPSRPGTRAQTEYVVRLTDWAGRPVVGAQVMLRGGMADGMSVVAPLRPAEEAVVYRGRVLYTMEGQWELTLGVTREGKRFELPLTEHVGR